MRTKGYTLLILILLAVIAAFSSCRRKTVPQKVDITIIKPEIDTCATIGDTSHKADINKVLDVLPEKTAEEKASKKEIKEKVNKALENTLKIDKEQTIQAGSIKATITPGKNGEHVKLRVHQPEEKQTYSLETQTEPEKKELSFYEKIRNITGFIIVMLIVAAITFYVIRK